MLLLKSEFEGMEQERKQSLTFVYIEARSGPLYFSAYESPPKRDAEREREKESAYVRTHVYTCPPRDKDTINLFY